MQREFQNPPRPGQTPFQPRPGVTSVPYQSQGQTPFHLRPGLTPTSYQLPPSYQQPISYQQPAWYQPPTSYQPPALSQPPTSYQLPNAYQPPTSYQPQGQSVQGRGLVAGNGAASAIPVTVDSLRRAERVTQSQTSVEKWLSDREASERRNVASSHGHGTQTVKPQTAKLQTPQKRKASMEGNRDGNVLDEDVLPIRKNTYQPYQVRDEISQLVSPLRRGFGAIVIDLTSDNEGDQGEEVQTPTKRAKTSHATAKKGQKIAQKKQSPKSKTKQPAESEGEAVANSLPQDYFFKRLTPDIRDRIYRHLLVSPKPIAVSGLWTELVRSNARRNRRLPTRHIGRVIREQEDDTSSVIDARILSVCKQAAEEGSRVLYSENIFLYKMRDPQSLPSQDPNMGGMVSRSGRNASPKNTNSSSRGAINFAKYGHLFRHMAVELESNRTGEEYERLLACALESLVDTDAYRKSYGLRCTPSWFPTINMFLQTLTITISPVWEEPEVEDDLWFDPMDLADEADTSKHLSVVKFFSTGHRVMKALRHINVRFIRVNLHVPEGPWDESDDGEVHSVSTDEENTRHLETTIDMRYHPAHVARNPDDMSKRLWQNDPLMPLKYKEMAAAAEQGFKELRKRIEVACISPNEAISRGWWEDHATAEQLRRERQARIDAYFDGNRIYGDDDKESPDTDSDMESDFEGEDTHIPVMVTFRRDPVTGTLGAHRTQLPL
ncbi:hypothetical protein QBC47DRAFT_428237 [Echria macrotheca]|uniref:Uncharacterized protein n=1 Tax=Echria macrotheca TaxID=438768 RepID=A0AAJ0BM77_9PEZI|nr:hypothetical protein QBC47DRAFT_428237 [Echria macrotheca]